MEDIKCLKCGSDDFRKRSVPRKDGTFGLVCRPCSNQSNRKYYYKYPERQLTKRINAISRSKDCALKRMYGIGIEEYDILYISQKGLCAICNKPETAVHSISKETRQLNVDHCHTTGKVRGLLCTNCNFGIGKFEDCPELLQKAIEYLKGNKD